MAHGLVAARRDHVLVTTMYHTILGDRWVYDGAADPTFVSVLKRTIIDDGDQAELVVEHGEDTTSTRPSPMEVSVTAGVGERIGVQRILQSVDDQSSAPALYGTWDGQDTPVMLARLAP